MTIYHHAISKTEKKKADIEKIWAEIFLEWLNNKYHFDYFARSVFNTPIDIDGISSSNTHLPLKIQLTEAKERDNDKEFNHALVYDLVQVQNCILRKEEKYKKQNVSVEEIILLIQGYLSYDWMLDDIKKLRQENKNSSFRGIYYVYPGDTNHPSFIIDIKDTFKK